MYLAVIIHRNKVDSFPKLNNIPAFILPQYKNISAINGCVIATFASISLNALDTKLTAFSISIEYLQILSLIFPC